MDQNENIKHLAAAFVARYTPAFVKHMAARGNPTLASVERIENWAGVNYVCPGGDVIHRVADYERVRFAPDVNSMFEACDAAIVKLGARLERSLNGDSVAKSFTGETTKGVDPVAKWGERGAILVSLGAAPSALLGDAPIVRICVDGRSGNDDTPRVLREDLLEARFGYYANTGPASEAKAVA